MTLGITRTLISCRIRHDSFPSVGKNLYSTTAHGRLTFDPGGTQEDKYAVVLVKSNAPDTILEEVEVSRAMFEIYEGGIVSLPKTLQV